ncbi:MAG: hypothetical protein CMB93_01135 [Flammeovirgaceae bacterium]|nr:hypothetical protein [Flammeovirgaceae bacterium]
MGKPPILRKSISLVTKNLNHFHLPLIYELSELLNDINDTLKEKDKINIIGLLDDNESLIGTSILDVPVLGRLDYYKEILDCEFYIFGIGSHKTHILRREIISKLGIDKKKFLTLIHPSVKIFSTSKVGEGSIIHFGSIVFNNTTIGPFTIIMALTVIGANNLVGEGCLITSSVSTTNGVKIGNYSFIGTKSAISENIEISPDSKISMCSQVRKNTDPGEFVFSNPSRGIKLSAVNPTIINEWSDFKSSNHTQ